MQQHLQAMFAVLNKVDKPDETITQGIRKLAEKILHQNHMQLKRDLNNFTSATSQKGSPFEINPVNIHLITEVLRFASKHCNALDQNIISVLQGVLEIVLPSRWQQQSDSSNISAHTHAHSTPFVLRGFQNNEQMRQHLILDICQSLTLCLTGQSSQKSVQELVINHLNSKHGLLMVIFSEQNQDIESYLDYAPLLQFLSQKRAITQRNLHQAPEKWNQSVKILRYVVKPELITPQDALSIQSLCIKDIFLKQNNSLGSPTSLDSLALFIKLSFIQKQSFHSEVNFNKILLIYLRVTLDKPQPQISIKRLATVLNTVLQTIEQELQSGSCDKEAHSILGELLEIVSLFCQSSGIQEMNKHLLPLLHQQAQLTNNLLSESTTELSNQNLPLTYLFSHLKNNNMFEDFLCALINVELKYMSKRNNTFESTFSSKFLKKLSQFSLQNQKLQTCALEIKIQSLCLRKSHPSQLQQLAACLKQEDNSELATKHLTVLFEQLLSYPEEFGSFLEEFTKTFKRKRYGFLFIDSCNIVFVILKDISSLIKFLSRVLSVLQYHLQQQFVVEDSDLLCLLEKIAQALVKSEYTLLNEALKEEYTQSMTKLWFLIALSNLINQDRFQHVLIELAALTPVINYDPEFQLQIRSAAKNQELDQFAESVFETLQNQVLNSRGVTLDNIVRKSFQRSRQEFKSNQELRNSDISFAEVEQENIEVGLELNLPERVFLAWFSQINRFKILSKNKKTHLGASFIEQVVSVFATESNFNVLQNQSNQSVSAQDLQKINTPFGKQLEFLTKALVSVHLDQGSDNNWSNDFCFLLKKQCADTWTTRYISKYLSQIYLMREPILHTQILNTYAQLLNVLQIQISQVYNSLSSQVTIEAQQMTLPEDKGLLKAISKDLINAVTQQYVAACVLGNRLQVDFNIKQIGQKVSISAVNQGNIGQRILQNLSLLEINVERLNVSELVQRFKFQNKSFVTQIQSLTNKIQQQQSNFSIFESLNQRQRNLTQTQPYERIQNPLLFSLNHEQPTFVQLDDYDQKKSLNIQLILLETVELVSLLDTFDTVQQMQNMGAKKHELQEILLRHYQTISSSQIQIQQQNVNENFISRANFYFSDAHQCKKQTETKLKANLQLLMPLCTENYQVVTLVQILKKRPLLLQNFLLYLLSELPQLLNSAVDALKGCYGPENIQLPVKWQKRIGRIQNSIVKNIKSQLYEKPNRLFKTLKITEQYQNHGLIHIDIILYLKNLGYQVDQMLHEEYLQIDDLYVNLMYVKLVLETGGDAEVVKKLAMKLLGKQFKSNNIEEVNQWVQLLVDIRYLLRKEEVVLTYLLSHFKWQIISWNFQFQITQQVADFSPPVLSSSAAKKFVKRWPDLALKIADFRINNKFLESYSEALADFVHSNPQKCLKKSHTLEIYLQSKSRKPYLANIWRSDNVIELIRSLSLKSKSDFLTCQIALKALNNASPKKVIFFLPQLFQSLRIDNRMNNLIGDFLVRKSQQSVSVAHNVLWFCKVESVLPDEREMHARKVPLPLQKENINQITTDLYQIIVKRLGSEERRFFETETNFFEKITSISGLLQPSYSKDQKKAIIKERLIEYNQEIPECVYLPTNQNCKVVGIVTSSGMPMQSAARVPILVSFEVEEYTGPDKDQLLFHETFVQSVCKTGKEILQSKKVQNALQKFQKHWVPAISEEDIEDDISFEQAAHDASINESIGANIDGNLQPRSSSTIQQLTRQLIPNRSMFTTGFKQVINKSRSDQNKQEDRSRVENEEDQRQFLKMIKQHTFKQTQNERPTSRISTVVSQIININQKAPNFKDILQQQLGTTTPLKLSRQQTSAKPVQRLNSEFDRAETSQATGSHQQIAGQIKIVSCIFKVNDDLRQDILALQFIKHFQRIFKHNDLDLFVAPYRCISNRTGTDKLLGGIIEVVPNSHSRDQLGKAFEINLHEYFLKKYGSESTQEFKTARYNFIRSLAAYAVVSFILQIKDRHNGNILIDECGHLIHIDFGFIFDWSPGKDMKFESAAFKLTQEFIDILGGSSNASAFRLFENLVIQGYLAVREHSEDFLSLTELMFYSGFPCFKPFSIQNLETRFRKDLSQAEAARWMRDLVQDAANKWTTRVYDFVQYKQNKIVF